MVESGLCTEDSSTTSKFGYGHLALQFAAPADLLRDAVSWFERSLNLFSRVKSPIGTAKSAHSVSLCYLEALFVPCAVLGVPISKASDIGPPVVRSFDQSSLNFVYNLEVNKDTDIGGLFGSSVGGSKYVFCHTIFLLLPPLVCDICLSFFLSLDL
jgi:hypothetical protein